MILIYSQDENHRFSLIRKIIEKLKGNIIRDAGFCSVLECIGKESYLFGE